MHHLVADALDHAPPDLTPAEVGVLVAISAHASSTADLCRIRFQDLRRRTRRTGPRGER